MSAATMLVSVASNETARLGGYSNVSCFLGRKKTRQCGSLSPRFSPTAEETSCPPFSHSAAFKHNVDSLCGQFPRVHQGLITSLLETASNDVAKASRLIEQISDSTRMSDAGAPDALSGTFRDSAKRYARQWDDETMEGPVHTGEREVLPAAPSCSRSHSASPMHDHRSDEGTADDEDEERGPSLPSQKSALHAHFASAVPSSSTRRSRSSSVAKHSAYDSPQLSDCCSYSHFLCGSEQRGPDYFSSQQQSAQQPAPSDSPVDHQQPFGACPSAECSVDFYSKKLCQLSDLKRSSKDAPGFGRGTTTASASALVPHSVSKSLQPTLPAGSPFLSSPSSGASNSHLLPTAEYHAQSSHCRGLLSVSPPPCTSAACNGSRTMHERRSEEASEQLSNIQGLRNNLRLLSRVVLTQYDKISHLQATNAQLEEEARQTKASLARSTEELRQCRETNQALQYYLSASNQVGRSGTDFYGGESGGDSFTFPFHRGPDVF